MSAYVVDTSVLIQYAIEQNQTREAVGLISRMYQGDTLHIPEFCLLECTNVVWKAVRFQGLSSANGVQIVEELNRLPFQVEFVSASLPNALQIGISHQLAIYDSLFIVLAKNLDLPLISVDQKQVRAAIATGAKTKLINDFAP